MSYADLSHELSGHLPGLPPLLADQYVKRAYHRIQSARLWSFLLTDDTVVCPSVVTAGSVSITHDSNQLTANAAASAALLALPTLTVPATLCQIRFPGLATTYQLYSIVALDSTTPTAVVLTLDRVVSEPTSTTATYQVYRAYVAIPVSTFLRWNSVVDPQNARPLDVDWTSRDFDRIDPQRSTTGPATRLGYYKRSSDQIPLYELWPHPTGGQTLYVRYRSQAIDFVNPDDTQDPVIPDDLIIQCALSFYAYPFAAANPQLFPTRRAQDWIGLIQGAVQMYQLMLQDAKRQDDNQMLQSVISRGRGRGRRWDRHDTGYPIDANFVQSHLVRF